MVPQRFMLFVVGLLLCAACGGQRTASGPPAQPAGASPAPAGSPGPPTPTAQLALPAPSPSPSPVVAASPVASPAASPIAQASPSPVAAASPAVAAATGALFRIVPDRSEASYHAREKFADRPLPSDAVGRTKEVAGEIVLERPGLLRGRVADMKVDLRTLTSDDSRRDNFIRQNTLQANRYPYAEFRSTEPAGPTSYSEGEEISFQVPGMMTIRGEERPSSWDVTARLVGDTLTGSGTARIKLSDFGLQAPSLAILTVEDEMRWEVQLTAEWVPG